MEMLASLLRLGLERGVQSPEHLHTTESEVIRQLLGDPDCAAKWQQFRSFSAVRREPEQPENGCWIRVPAKLRCIDPLVLDKGRISQWSSQCRALLEEFQQTRFDYWVGCDN